MAANEYLPVFKPGLALTFTAGAALTGGRLVEITTDNTIEHAAAGSTSVVGVAAWDTTLGQQVTTHSGGVQELVASAAIAAGDEVSAAADGKVATTVEGTAVIGVALTAASAADALVRVKARF